MRIFVFFRCPSWAQRAQKLQIDIENVQSTATTCMSKKHVGECETACGALNGEDDQTKRTKDWERGGTEGKLPPADWEVKQREDRPEIRGDSLSVVSWVNGTSRCACGPAAKRGRAQKKEWQWWEKGWTHPVERTEEIRQTHLQTSQEHCGYVGNSGKKRWEVESTKTISGYWDGRAKDLRSGCWVVINAVDTGEGGEVTVCSIALQWTK